MFELLKKFRDDRQGHFAIWFGLTFGAASLAVALSVDSGNVTRHGEQLQASLDSALLSVARNYDPTAPVEQNDVNGTMLLETNLAEIGQDTTDFKFMGAETDVDGNVILSAEAVNPFSSKLVSNRDTVLTRKSSVIRERGSEACVLALSPTASQAIDLNGTTDVAVNGCVLASNSEAEDSVSRSGSAELAAACVHTTGGTSGISGDTRVDLDCGEPNEHSFVTADPLASYVPPSDVGCNQLALKGGKSLQKIDAKIYCNNKVTINGGERVQLNAGTYVFKGTDISILGGGEFTGSGVSIFLYDGAKLTVAANAVFNIVAPTTGATAGIAIYSEKGNAVEIKLNGGSSQSITGFIYNPSGSVFMAGNASTSSSQCIRIVADTIDLTGTSQFKTDCQAELGDREIVTIKQIRLVN